VFFEFLGGVDEARTSQTLSFDTKIDVSPNGIENSSLKRGKKLQRWMHGWAHDQAHGRASGAETGGYADGKKMKAK